jgi:hypothetical protein
MWAGGLRLGSAAGDAMFYIDRVDGTWQTGDPLGFLRVWRVDHLERGWTRLETAGGRRRIFDAGGVLVAEDVPLRTVYGALADGDAAVRLDLRGDGRPILLGPGAAVTDVEVTRTAGGGFRLSHQGAGAHHLDYREIDGEGRPLRERIAFVTPEGTYAGKYFDVDMTTPNPSWTLREDAPGRQLTVPGPPGHFRPAYNSQGTVSLPRHGGLRLLGSDGAVFYSREKLGSRRTLEVLTASTHRYWHEWEESAGLYGRHADRGHRVFGVETNGARWSDFRHALGWQFSRPVREGRTTLEKGSVRAERQLDGSWRWYRFDKDGRQQAEGVREKGWRHTADFYGGSARPPAPAQIRYSNLNPLSTALHYREYPFVRGARARPEWGTTIRRSRTRKNMPAAWNTSTEVTPSRLPGMPNSVPRRCCGRCPRRLLTGFPEPSPGTSAPSGARSTSRLQAWFSATATIRYTTGWRSGRRIVGMSPKACG